MKRKKQMVFQGEFSVEDLVNGFRAEGKFIDPPAKPMFGGFFSSSKPEPIKPEALNRVEISIKKHGGVVVSKGQ